MERLHATFACFPHFPLWQRWCVGYFNESHPPPQHLLSSFSFGLFSTIFFDVYYIFLTSATSNGATHGFIFQQNQSHSFSLPSTSLNGAAMAVIVVHRCRMAWHRSCASAQRSAQRRHDGCTPLTWLSQHRVNNINSLPICTVQTGPQCFWQGYP